MIDKLCIEMNRRKKKQQPNIFTLASTFTPQLIDIGFYLELFLLYNFAYLSITENAFFFLYIV